MNSSASKGFLKAILIVGIFFIISYFYSYNKWLDHDFNKVDMTYRYDSEDINTNTNTTEKIDQSGMIDVSSEFKEKHSDISYELFETTFGEEFYDVFYNGGNITDEFYIYLGVANIIKNNVIINCKYNTEITSQELKNKIVSIVGNVNYTDKSFTTKNGYLIINYDESKNVYIVKINNKCGGLDYSSGGIKTVFQKALKNDNYLYIYENAFYIKSSKDSSGNVIFDYHEDIDSNSRIIANSYDKIDLNLLPTYIFKYKINGNIYTLESITKE